MFPIMRLSVSLRVPCSSPISAPFKLCLIPRLLIRFPCDVAARDIRETGPPPYDEGEMERVSSDAAGMVSGTVISSRCSARLSRKLAAHV